MNDSKEINFVKIPSDDFYMGSIFHTTDEAEFHNEWYRDEAPLHKVSITESYELSNCQITIGKFRSFIQETGYKTSAELSKVGSLGKFDESSGTWVNDISLYWNNTGYNFSDDCPVVHSSWKDAVAFCNWLNGKNDGYYYSLPSEAEWEYAGGNGIQTKFSWGNMLPDENNGGNIGDRALKAKFPTWKYPVYEKYDDGFALLAPVKSFSPNTFGLYDMTGNVWEWVDDYYNIYDTVPKLNPLHLGVNLNAKECNTNISHEKVVKGGGFDWEIPFLRIQKRRKILIDDRYINSSTPLKYTSAINIGFRIKRVANEYHKKHLFRDIIFKILRKIVFDQSDIVDYLEKNITQEVIIKNIISNSANQFYFHMIFDTEINTKNILCYFEVPESKYGTIGLHVVLNQTEELTIEAVNNPKFGCLIRSSDKLIRHFPIDCYWNIIFM